MATRVYFTSQSYTGPLTSVGWDSEWEGQMSGGTLRHRKGWANVPGAPSRPNSSNDGGSLVKSGADTFIGEYYGARVYFGPLKGGTTVSGSQTISGGFMGGHDASWGFHWMTMGAKIVDSGGTLQKDLTVLATAANAIYYSTNSFPASSLSSRYDTGVSNATNYTTANNDWLLIELGCHIETSGSVNFYIQFGDGNASDIDSTESTTNRNPFFEMTTNFELLTSNNRIVMPHQSMIGIEAT